MVVLLVMLSYPYPFPNILLMIVIINISKIYLWITMCITLWISLISVDNYQESEGILNVPQGLILIAPCVDTSLCLELYDSSIVAVYKG